MEQREQEPIQMMHILIRVKKAFLQLWPLVVVLGLLLGFYQMTKTKQAFVPMYESKAIFTVDAGYTADDIFGTGAFYDQYAAEQMAAVFPQILATSMMRDLVLDQIEGGYINGYASAYAVADSSMLVLTVQSTVPADAKAYLEAIIECYPQVAVYMVDNPQMKIMQNPDLPTEPINSYSGLSSAAKGGILGILLGMVVVVIFGMTTHTIQTADELRSNINLPILVALPKVSMKKRRKGGNNMITAESDPNMAECLRGLRMKVKKLLKEPEKKTVLVTSTLAGEGKTTVALNLGLSLMKEGYRVVVLDADIRNQSVARALGENDAATGLLELIKDPSLSVMDAVRTVQEGKLAFISGRSTDRRHYNIDRASMQRILGVLKEHYDYVILDTPPCEVVSDAASLCRYADCVLFVVKQDHAKRGQIINAVTSLYQKDVKIDGCIFNSVPQTRRQYGYGYRSTYGYGYSYGYRKYGYSHKYTSGYSKYQPDTDEA